ncbi:MAG TPA: hypothetical protein VGB53_02070 [Rubricoccaceae bacterium]|jgi:GNAT superfamily N-acetyltransferase
MPDAAIRFEPATGPDDAALRALVRATPMPGAVSLVQTREPSFFAADAALGEHVETLVARESPGGPPLALLQRAERPVWLGGQVRRAAYLGGLRVHPAHRGRGIARGGWAAVGAWHESRPADLTLAALTAESRAASRVFVERPGAPGTFARFRPVADLVTLALPVRKARTPPEAEAGRAEPAPIPRDLSPAGPLHLPGLGDADRFTATRSGRAVGSVSVWEPAEVRQTHVAGYSGALRWARPLANAAARTFGIRPLPAPGERLRSAFAVGLWAEDAGALDALLDAALARCHARRLAFLLVGFDAADPLARHARRRLHVPYRSTLHVLVWPGERLPAVRRPVHAEIATY